MFVCQMERIRCTYVCCLSESHYCPSLSESLCTQHTLYNNLAPIKLYTLPSPSPSQLSSNILYLVKQQRVARPPDGSLFSITRTCLNTAVSSRFGNINALRHVYVTYTPNICYLQLKFIRILR